MVGSSMMNFGVPDGKKSGVNSVTTTGQGLASKIGFALSRVVQKNNSGNDEEEVKDLIQLVDELNQSTDLNVKLKS